MDKMTITKTLTEFGHHLKLGAEHIATACAIYATAVAEDHTVVLQFEEAFPYITKTTWDKMRLVGVGAIRAKILMLSDRFASKLVRLTLDQQDAVLDDKIPVYTRGKVAYKDVTELTDSEIKMVFTPAVKKRTVAEQKAIVKQAKKPSTASAPYEVQGQTLNVRRACVISKAELAAILKRMK